MTGRDFDLLREIYQEIKDLRTELLIGHENNERRINDLEKFQYNLMGKIGVGVLFVGGAVTFVMNIVYQFIVDRIK